MAGPDSTEGSPQEDDVRQPLEGTQPPGTPEDALSRTQAPQQQGASESRPPEGAHQSYPLSRSSSQEFQPYAGIHTGESIYMPQFGLRFQVGKGIGTIGGEPFYKAKAGSYTIQVSGYDILEAQAVNPE